MFGGMKSFGLVLRRNLTLGFMFYCRTIVPIVAATIGTIVRHSTLKLSCGNPLATETVVGRDPLSLELGCKSVIANT
jgi:hypothetical protein